MKIGEGGGIPDLPSLQKPGEKSPKYALQLYTQAVNLLNHPNLMNFVGVQTSPLFGRPTLALPGRRLELGVKFSF